MTCRPLGPFRVSWPTHPAPEHALPLGAPSSTQHVRAGRRSSADAADGTRHLSDKVLPALSQPLSVHECGSSERKALERSLFSVPSRVFVARSPRSLRSRQAPLRRRLSQRTALLRSSSVVP